MIGVGKKIAVITGSPRKNGNSAAMAEAFVKAAEAKGYNVTRFDAAMMDVKGCRACDACNKTGKACAFDDDFNKIAPAVKEADAVVFAMPLYWYTMPAQIKAVVDKFYSFFRGGGDISGKKCALIACCEERDESAFDGLRFAYERSVALLEWENVGEVLVPGVNAAGDIEKTDGCARAAALAELL